MGDKDRNREKEKDTLTPLELQVMQVIWRLGPGDVNAVQAGLGQQLAYTTVQTMLNILHRKGKLKRTLRGRAFQYAAAETEAKAHSHALRDLVKRMFAGSSEQLVMSLIKDRQLDAEQIARLSRRFEEQASQREPGTSNETEKTGEADKTDKVEEA